MNQKESQQGLFVEAFCSSPTFNATQAAKDAGYAEASAHIRGWKLLQKPNIQKAITKRLAKRKEAFWIKEDIILKKLWEEATNTDRGSSHAARINALVWLGKHLGMWQERIPVSEESQITYNVINYSDNGQLKEKIVDKIEENKEEVEQQKDESLPEGIVLLDYNKIPSDARK